MAPGTPDLLMCHTCGTQFDIPADKPLAGCKICDDPRQWLPPSGQKWTSLGAEQALGHKNHLEPLTININSDSSRSAPTTTSDDKSITTKVVPNVYTLYTEPKLGIGERAILIITPHGNVLWDAISYLDDDTVQAIKAHGELKAIVISHPHYYTTHLDWAEAFDCPVYFSADDQEWLSRKDNKNRRRLIRGETEEILPGVTAVKVGGHFPGSLVLHWDKILFLGDSLVTQPSALYHVNRPAETISYTFMWSIPNMIPLPPTELMRMWRAIQPFDIEQTHGAFMGQDVRDPNVKRRILESMQIQAKNSTGGEDHEICREKLS